LMFMEVIPIKNTEVTKSLSQFLEKNNCLVEGMGFIPTYEAIYIKGFIELWIKSYSQFYS